MARLIKVKHSGPLGPPPPRTPGVERVALPEFEKGFRQVAQDLSTLVELADREGDNDLRAAINGTGGLLVGIWLELHRIANALESRL